MLATHVNAHTVDGDTANNGACVLAATGTLGNAPLLEANSADYRALCDAVGVLCQELATAIVRDGEGATKLVTLVVEEAADGGEARRVADTIAHSPLVKTALFASDPNWGRILAAVERSGLPGLDIDRVRICLTGALTVDFTDPDAAIPRSGVIAVQLHGGARARVAYREILLEELP